MVNLAHMPYLVVSCELGVHVSVVIGAFPRTSAETRKHNVVTNLKLEAQYARRWGIESGEIVRGFMCMARLQPRTCVGCVVGWLPNYQATSQGRRRKGPKGNA
jgi:hypothetical protein